MDLTLFAPEPPIQEYIFDSYMKPTSDLIEGELRLLEVDNPLYLPVYSKIRLDITVPDLVLNDDDADTVVSAPPTFVILDAVEEYKKSRQNDNNENDNKKMSTPTKTPTAASSSSDTGLRQRKGDSNNDNNSSDGDSGWVVVDNDTNENQAMIMKELNIVEPIELIAGGLPPKELKLAQKQAQIALREYINIANKATILLSTLNQNQQTEAQ